MSRAFANVSLTANGDTFASWISKTNQILFAYSNTVTLASNTDGDTTTGNGFIIGIFGANTLVANVIQGGNVSSQSPLTLLNNVNFSNSTVGFNGVSTSFNFAYSTSNTAAQIVDSFFANTYAGGKYLVTIKNNVSLDRHLTELLVLQAGASNAQITDYGALTTNASLGTFSANVDTGSVRLWFTPASANNTLQIKKDLLVA